jgi:cell division protein FtsL
MNRILITGGIVVALLAAVIVTAIAAVGAACNRRQWPN